MQAYPQEYVEHNLPLVFLSGVGERQDHAGVAPSTQENGTRIVTGSAECSGDRARQLLDQLLNLDGSKQPWNAQALPGPSSTLKWRMRTIGRTFSLPARKAAPLPHSPNLERLSSSPQRSTELHSPLSPQSPGSPIYPDGVFTKLWVAKHQRQVPALLIAFFELSADEDSAQNEQIQIDINAIRTALGISGFKTRIAAVLMSDRSILRAPELADRLTAIRRATTLDTKTGLFFMPPMSSQAEIATYVQTMLTALQPLAVEYYRDLTKHARRKKIRGGPAGSSTTPVDGGAHALSTSGWNARYEVKQGVFAEFRQEMEVAERHYSAALEELFGSDGILEATPSWSPRWDEARLLCDVVALRVLRCELWSDLTTSAVISWTNYKARMRDLVDRRGKGTQTYSWHAWETRWAEIMAQLIQRAAVPAFRAALGRANEDSSELAALALYAPTEKTAVATERLPPFHLLHHPGYWLRLAVSSARARWLVALAIPEEDRTPPGQSPASAVAYRSKNYDTFLASDPHEEYPLAEGHGYDHIADISRLTDEAIREFALRSQGRATDRLNFDLAQQLAATERFPAALDRLVPIWEECSWRDDDWNDLVVPLLTLLHDCARRCGNVEVHVATAWELLSLSSPTGPDGLLEYLRSSWPKASDGTVRFEDRQRHSPLNARFAFGKSETHVGDQVECQLTLWSQAPPGTPALTLSKVKVTVGTSKTITITNKRERDWSPDGSVLYDFKDVATENADGSLVLEADLRLPHAQKRIYGFRLSFKEAGVLRLQQLSLQLKDEQLSIEHTYSDPNLVRGASFFAQVGDVLEARPLPCADATAVTVLPKPPKLQMVVHGLLQQYYLNEVITLELELVNDEAEAVDATATVSAATSEDRTVAVRWQGKEDNGHELDIGMLRASAARRASLYMTAPLEPAVCTLALEVKYTLISDPSTPLSKTMDVEVSIVEPFQATYTIGPLLHSDPWPSYFAAHQKDTHDQPEGIKQRWRQNSLLRSCAADALLIRAVRLVKASDSPDAECSMSDPTALEDHLLEPEHEMHVPSEFTTQKLSFDDRRPTSLNLMLHVDWSRGQDAETVTAILEVPRLNLPSSEPRVLCTVANDESGEHGLTLQYHIENPSGHFLTFALTMEANEAFAFSGPKYRTLSLAPVSRVCVQYRLLVHDEGDEAAEGRGNGRWIWPVLQVVDSYYNKALRIHAGGPEVKIDEKGKLGIRVVEAEE
ncbi:hypothetical protein LTS02_008788 [Friedmanniomyces endolithicus]|nr:hypothetical protein LTS02_008788 [Friedmanniomyces endolithicus]